MNRIRQITESPSLCMALACALLLVGLLTGCGGGGDDEDDKAGAQPVNCKAHPELCK